MTNYNYYFELAATLILIFILVDSKMKRQLYRADAKVFIATVWSQMLFSLTDLISCELLLRYDTVPKWINVAVADIYFICQATLLYCFALFIFTYTAHNVHFSSKYVILITTLFVFNLIVTIATPIVGDGYFYFDESGYHQGSLSNMGYSYYVIYMILIIVLLFLRRRSFLNYEAYTIVAAVGFVVAGVILQFLFRLSLVIGLFDAIAILMLYVSMENPNSFIDKMTGCNNKEALSRRMENWNKKNDYSVIFINISRFDRIRNDVGHVGAEELLRFVAMFLKLNVNKTVYRVSDETFAIIKKGRMDDVREDVLYINNRFITSWGLRNHSRVMLECDIAVIEYPTYCFDYTSLLSICDYLFYKLKRTSGQNVIYVDDELYTNWKRKIDVEDALRRGIEEDSLVVHFQPIYDAVTGQLRALEALSRLTDPVLGKIPPDEFISIAEETGLIVELGQVVFRQVCCFIKDYLLPMKNCPVRCIDVNLSPIELTYPEVINKFMNTMEDFGIPPKMICFEITESATADSPEAVFEAMEKLMSVGSRFALDDYGTGYSNISYLVRFPFDIIKFDKQLVWSYFDDKNAGIIMKKEFELIKALGKDIVVEGIESIEMYDNIKKAGVRYYQGILFSWPQPPEVIAEYIKNPTPEELFEDD